MRNLAAVLDGPESVSIESRLVPTPRSGEVLVAIRAVGVCGSDSHYYHHGRIGDFVVEAPLVLGHECSGLIVGLGDAVSDRAVGQRVAVEPGMPCGRCESCRTGRYNLCPEIRFLGTPPVDGAFTQYLAVDAALAHPVPDELDDEQAALLEPLSVAVWANRRGGTRVGDRVLVTGAGPVGLLSAQVARCSGATRVALIDKNRGRLAHAASLGLETVNSLEGLPFTPDVLLECTGAPPVTHAATAILGPGGRAILVGMCGESDISVPISAIQTREITLTGTFRYANTYPAAIALATSGDVSLDGIVGLRYPLPQVEAALRAHLTHPDVLKSMVTLPEL